MPDRVTAHLLGDNAPEPRPHWCCSTSWATPARSADRLAHALARRRPAGAHPRAGDRHRRRRPPSPPSQATGRDAVVVDLTLLARGPDPARAWSLACAREALLRGAGLVAGPVEALAEQPRGVACSGCRRWPSPVLFVGTRDLGPPLVDDAAAGRGGAGPRRRASGSPCCREQLERVGADVDPDSLGAHLSLGPGAGAARRPRRAVRGPARRRPGHRRRPAARRPGPERRRARAAGPPDRARGRLGRPGAGARRTPGARGAGRAGPAPRPGARRLADAARAAAAAAA